MNWTYYAWIVIWAAGLAVELVGVHYDGRRGVVPLTTIVRDRLMKHHWYWKLGVFVFWAWLGVHFFLQAPPW